MSNEEFDFTDAHMIRMKAEEQLKETLKKTDKPEIEADVRKLLHELQVHQIELEMQNEELKQAYVTAEIALKKYTMLYDLAPIGYFILNSDGMINELNFTGANMLGEKRFSLVNSNFRLFVFEDSRHEFNDFFKKVYTNGSKESCDIMLGYGSKSLGQVYIEAIVTGEDQKCLLSVMEISGLKK